MNVGSRRYANALVVTVSGRLDQDSCDAFRNQLTGFVADAAQGGGAVVLDLSGLEYISSAGLRCFMLASREARTKNARVVVASLQPMVAEIFAISHFNLVFQVFPDVREALASVSAQAAAAFDKG
jgi:anti-sigma B factor antagonist